MIQNKIPSEYVCKGELKGFVNEFYFYQPWLDIRPSYESNVLFLPDIKTHKHNILLGKLNPNEKQHSAEVLLKRSLFVIGRKDYINECVADLNDIYKRGQTLFTLIRGVTGSGKSLFLRKVLHEFVEHNKELKNKLK